MATLRAAARWSAALATSTLLLAGCLTQSEFFSWIYFGILPSGMGPRSGQLMWEVTTGGCSSTNLGGGATGVQCSFISPTFSKTSSVHLRDLPPGTMFDSVFGAMVLQMPESVSNVRGTYSGAASGTLTVRSALDVLHADIANAIVAERGMKLWVIEPPPSAGSYRLTINMDEAGTAPVPMPMKVLFTEKVDANGRTYYPPFFPCTTNFATVTATSLPAVSVSTQISYAPLLAQSGCSNKAYSFGPIVTVVEFYNQALDHYFITWMGNEIALLDAGNDIAPLDAGKAIKGWARTGQSFKAYIAAQPNSTDICRVYIIPLRGDSHFFGRGQQECDGTMAAHPDFVLEDPKFMALFLPVAGVCPAGTVNVYRAFSNRPDANHRYTTDAAIRAQMVSRGWLAEGDGPNLVVMCAPA